MNAPLTQASSRIKYESYFGADDRINEKYRSLKLLYIKIFPLEVTSLFQNINDDLYEKTHD